jgi:hypothetical protein
MGRHWVVVDSAPTVSEHSTSGGTRPAEIERIVQSTVGSEDSGVEAGTTLAVTSI